MARPIFTARPEALARIPLHPAHSLTGEATTADHGSPLLEEAVTMASSSTRDAAREGAAALTWRAYANRAATRTIPHGVFAGVAAATFAPVAALRLREGHRASTYPDSGWLAALSHRLLHSPGGLEGVMLTTSNLTTLRGDSYEIESPVRDSPARPAMTSVRATQVTRFVLATCRNGAHGATVLAEIARRWPRATPDAGPLLLRELLDRGFLLHDLVPDDPRCDPLEHLLERIPEASPYRSPLERLAELLAAADRLHPGDVERLGLLSEALSTAHALVRRERLLRVDTVVDAALALPEEVARQAEQAASLLWRISWGTDPLADYHQRFLTRYGTTRAVPVLDVLDPVIGLGPIVVAGSVGAGAGDPARSAILAGLLADAAAQGSMQIVLNDTLVERLTCRLPGEVPRTAEIYLRLLADPTADCGYGVAVSGGSPDAESTSGRFARLLGRSPRYDDDGRGAAVAELVVVPRLSSLASVTPPTGFAPYRIPVGVAARPGDIDPAELTVRSDGRRLNVWSMALDRPVRPVLFARTALPLLPPLTQFLAMAGHSGERPWHCWTWADLSVAFTPAVRYRNILLAPARWILPQHLAYAAADADRWEQALEAWRTGTCPRPPEVVTTDEADRQLVLDLRRADDRELLRRYVRRGLLALTAPPSEGSAAVLPGPDGHHLLEVVVSLDRTDPAATSPTTTTAVRRDGDDLYLPGGPWLSLALQAPATCHEAVLMALAEHLEQFPGGWDRWFWLRFSSSSHGEHLRIRFHGDPAKQGGTLLPALSRWAADLRSQRLISGFCLEPYERETERYGGPDAITAAERFFDADSRLTLTVLTNTRREEQRLAAAAHAAAAIVERVGTGTTALAVRLDRAAHRHANALRPQTRAATLATKATGWKKALDSYAGVLSRRCDRIASDLIHLHCNRLAPDAEPLIRALAADLLAHRAHLAEGSR